MAALQLWQVQRTFSCRKSRPAATCCAPRRGANRGSPPRATPLKRSLSAASLCMELLVDEALACGVSAAALLEPLCMAGFAVPAACVVSRLIDAAAAAAVPAAAAAAAEVQPPDALFTAYTAICAPFLEAAPPPPRESSYGFSFGGYGASSPKREPHPGPASPLSDVERLDACAAALVRARSLPAATLLPRAPRGSRTTRSALPALRPSPLPSLRCCACAGLSRGLWASDPKRPSWSASPGNAKARQ